MDDEAEISESCRKPAPAVVNCLGNCGRPFRSKDPSRNRICERCQTRNVALSSRVQRGPSRSTGLSAHDLSGE